MTTRIPLPTALATALLAVGALGVAACGSGSDATTGTAPSVSQAVAARIERACTQTEAAALALQRAGTARASAALAAANAQVDRIGVGLANVTVPQQAAPAWKAVVGHLAGANDAIESGMSAVVASGAAQSARSALTTARSEVDKTLSSLTLLGAELGIPCTGP